mgnify:CR=1 FL=1
MFGKLFGRRSQTESPHTEADSDHQPLEPTNGLQSNMVWLLYELPPEVDAQILLTELRNRCGKVERIGDQPNLFAFAMLDHILHVGDGKVPAQVVLSFPEQGQDTLDLTEALQQSWKWRDAEETVKQCKVKVAFFDLMAFEINYQNRLALFHAALESVLMVAPCQAIYWVESQQIINPSDYLSARRASEFHPLEFALNLRFFNIPNEAHSEFVVDTVGLNICGLPDLQCHFLDLDPNAVGRKLYQTAFYLYEKGDIIRDGNTISGLKLGSKWKCQHESSLVKPDRIVIDVNPGKPHAAGNR